MWCRPNDCQNQKGFDMFYFSSVHWMTPKLHHLPLDAWKNEEWISNLQVIIVRISIYTKYKMKTHRKEKSLAVKRKKKNSMHSVNTYSLKVEWALSIMFYEIILPRWHFFPFTIKHLIKLNRKLFEIEGVVVRKKYKNWKF